MDKTIVVAKCVSKKQNVGYDKSQPTAHVVELEVPYDQNSIYWKLSGGTNIELNTINQEAADMFTLGKDYDIVISPSEQ